MEKLKIGAIVKSIAGHDQNCFFVILNMEDEYVYLVDGKTRKLAKPKRKKIKHIQFINKVNNEFVSRLNENTLLDAHIRKVISKELANNMSTM